MGRILATVAAITLTACAPAAPPQAKAAQAHPTIVSLNPCTDAVLAEVADPGQLLAISAYSHDPDSSSMDLALARRFPAVSGSVEEVLALQPDVVVGTPFMGPAAGQAMARLGLRLEQVGIATSVDDSIAQIRQLAALAGQPARGEALIARIHAALAANAAPAGPPVPALVWQSGGIVPGEQTLIADLMRRTGFSNLAAAQGLGQADVLPLEMLLTRPPRVILAAGDSLSNEDRMLYHPALGALRQTRRERLDPTLLWCGGPSIIKTANRLGEVRRAL